MCLRWGLLRSWRRLPVRVTSNPAAGQRAHGLRAAMLRGTPARPTSSRCARRKPLCPARRPARTSRSSPAFAGRSLLMPPLARTTRQQDATPPKDVNVLVRALKDHGERIFAFGRATVRTDKTFYLPADEAEPLIKEGIVERIPHWDAIS